MASEREAAAAGEQDPIGVLVMAYGTASGPEDIERYYTDIRGGRPPSAEHLAGLRERYAAIGNRFPLTDVTRRQAEALERDLNETSETKEFRAYLGVKHAPPFIPEAVERMRDDGIRQAVGIVMAPHWSGMSVETYVQRVEAAAGAGGPSFTFVRHWHDHPLFVEFLASRVTAALDLLTDEKRERAAVVFSAHSLPQRPHADGATRCKLCSSCDGAAGCRYVTGLRETADLVAKRLGLSDHAVGWQSAGRTGDPWLGPSVEEVIRELAETGRSAVVSCSAGFVADNLEILYDLDVEARAAAEDAGLAFVRTEMPNDDPAFIRILTAVVLDHFEA